MEHAAASQQLAGLLRRTVEEVVEVGIDTQQQFVRGFGNHAQQHLFTLREVAPRRNGDLESQIGVGKTVEDPAPEGDILVPFDKNPHQSLRRVYGQGLGQLLPGRSKGVDGAQLIDEFAAHKMSKDNILLFLHKTNPAEWAFDKTKRTFAAPDRGGTDEKERSFHPFGHPANDIGAIQVKRRRPGGGNGVEESASGKRIHRQHRKKRVRRRQRVPTDRQRRFAGNRQKRSEAE